MRYGSLTILTPCDWLYINFIENFVRLTSLMSASESMLFDTKPTYTQKVEREAICPVLKICCGSEAKANDHFPLEAVMVGGAGHGQHLLGT